MDWLDEEFEKLGKWVRNLSLRKALAVYIIICITIVVILYALTTAICDRWDNYIWSQQTQINNDDSQRIIVYARDYSTLSKFNLFFAKAIEAYRTWSILLYSIGGTIGISFLFYSKKLKGPLQVLKEASDQVGNNNLDFEIYYDNKDEMGDLCHSFDDMRRQLIANNQKMWDMMEEQKRLNAAFAHDLRTPLTVLKGYTDFLYEYIPEGKISEEKLLSTLSMMSGNIERLDRYSNTMKEINSFEEIPVHQLPMESKELLEKVEEVIKVLNGKNGITVSLINAQFDFQNKLNLDIAIVMEVFENLMSNALRYAKTEVKIIVEISEKDNLFLLSVTDDGKGFSLKDLSMAAKPYYTDSTEIKSTHFGIGLYISKLLCEKHGGWIFIGNGINNGAIVTAAFSTLDK